MAIAGFLGVRPAAKLRRLRAARDAVVDATLVAEAEAEAEVAVAMVAVMMLQVTKQRKKYLIKRLSAVLLLLVLLVQQYIKEMRLWIWEDPLVGLLKE